MKQLSVSLSVSIPVCLCLSVCLELMKKKCQPVLCLNTRPRCAWINEIHTLAVAIMPFYLQWLVPFAERFEHQFMSCHLSVSGKSLGGN